MGPHRPDPLTDLRRQGVPCLAVPHQSLGLMAGLDGIKHQFFDASQMVRPQTLLLVLGQDLLQGCQPDWQGRNDRRVKGT